MYMGEDMRKDVAAESKPRKVKIRTKSSKIMHPFKSAASHTFSTCFGCLTWSQSCGTGSRKVFLSDGGLPTHWPASPLSHLDQAAALVMLGAGDSGRARRWEWQPPLTPGRAFFRLMGSFRAAAPGLQEGHLERPWGEATCCTSVCQDDSLRYVSS